VDIELDRDISFPSSVSGVASPAFSELPNIRSLALLYAASLSSLDNFSLADNDLSLPSLPVSDVALEGLPPVSPPLRMIFIAGSVGGGVLPDVGGFEILVSDCGNLQNGVLKMRTDPATASN